MDRMYLDHKEAKQANACTQRTTLRSTLLSFFCLHKVKKRLVRVALKKVDCNFRQVCFIQTMFADLRNGAEAAGIRAADLPVTGIEWRFGGHVAALHIRISL